MPIYEYRCQECAHEFEQMQKVSDRPLRKCPKCSGKLEKLLSRTSFQLKGAGWYAQGYTKDGKPKSAAADKEAPAKAKSESTKDTSSASSSAPAAPSSGGKKD